MIMIDNEKEGIMRTYKCRRKKTEAYCEKLQII